MIKSDVCILKNLKGKRRNGGIEFLFEARWIFCPRNNLHLERKEMSKAVTKLTLGFCSLSLNDI